MPRYRLDVELTYNAIVEVEADNYEWVMERVYDGDYVVVDQDNSWPIRVQVTGKAREVAEKKL